MKKIYITDRKRLPPGKTLLSTIDSILPEGLYALYLREMDLNDSDYIALAKQVQSICKKYNTSMILPSHVSFLDHFPTAWVQVGKGRPWIKNRITGYSAHGVEEAIQASQKDVDYIFLSPIFSTPSKTATQPLGLEPLKWLSQQIATPVFALGGIQTQHFSELEKTGIAGIAGIGLFQCL